MNPSRSAPSRSLPLVCALLCLAAPASAEPASLEAVRQALRDRTYSQAEELSAKRLEAHPEDTETQYLNALALFHQGKLEAARAQAERLVAAKPNSRWIHKARFLAAECQVRLRSFPGAVQILRAQAQRLLSAERKREVCGVILSFADALARIPDPNDPSELDKPRPDYRKAYALYSKALELEIDTVQRAEVLFKRARAAERMNPRVAYSRYHEYLNEFDPSYGDAPGREKRPVGAQRWEARERMIRAALAMGAGQAVDHADDLLRLLASPAGQGAPADLAATTAWLQLRAYRLPRPSAQVLPAALRAVQTFLERYPRHPGGVAAAYWRAEALAVHQRHDEAVASFESFLAGKSFTAPSGESAAKPLDGLKKTPQELLGEWNQTAVFRIAALRGQQARYADAIKRYEEYTRRFPNGPQWAAAHSSIREAQFQLCLESVREKRYDEARGRFDRFLAAHPLDGRAAQVLFLLGQLRVAEAEALIELAQEKSGDKKAAVKNPQVVQRFKQAIAAWARLASKYPNSNEAALALYQTGVIQEERFDALEEALKTYRRVTRGSASSQARARIALLTRESLSVLSPRVFRTNEGAAVEVETRNLKTLSVRQYFLDLEGYFRKHHEIGGVERLDIGLIQPDATFEVTIDGFRKYAPRKQAVAVPFPKGKAGVCLVSVTGGDYEATTLVVRSDLELVFRASREELLAFAQDARLGKPAAGVKVLLSDGEKVFTTGTTGKDGVLRVKHERLRGAGKLRLFAQQGAQVAASGLSLSGLSSGLKLAPRGYLYCDRPAYQPGQVVHAKGVVRDAGDAGYEVPSAKQYRVRLLGPRGRVLDEELAPLTRFGTFCASFTLDASVPVGDYRVVAGPVAEKGKPASGPSATGTFTVQQFELRPVELKLTAPRTVYRRGEVVELSAEARFAWGQPLVGKRVQVRLPNGRVKQLETDAEGLIKVSFDTSGRPAGQPLSFSATLIEEGVHANLTVFMPRLGYSLSVTPSQPLVLAGEPVEVEVRSSGPDGKPVARKLTLFVQRRELPSPDPVLAKVPWFGRRSRAVAARTIQTHTLETDAAGVARLSVELPEGGDYVLRAVGEDRFQQQVVAEGRVKASGEEDATRLRIFSKEATLKVGRSNSARIHSRLKKATLALVTYEGDAVLEYRILSLKAGFTQLETAVDHLHFPNFRLAVTALEAQALHTAHKDFKVERELKVRIKPSQERQAPGSVSTVEIEVTDQLGRPVQAELSLALVEETLYARYAERAEPIRDAFEKGATRRAEFRVAASNGFKYQAKTTKILQALKDEANRLDELSKQEEQLRNLELSQAEADDEAPSFGRRRGMRAKKMRSMPRPSAAPNAQSGRELANEPMMEGKSFDRAAGGAGGGGGGGAGKQAQPRQDALGGGFWKCQITTDAKGRATIKVPLPERATRWRFTARGVTTATLVGQARAEVITAKDFFCELLAPRHVRTGDRPQLLARVHGKPGLKVDLGLAVKQGQRTRVSTRRESIVLGPGGTSEVLLPEVEVPSSDALTFVLSASGSNGTLTLTDSVAKAVEVLPWGEELVAHGGGTADGDASVSLRLPRGELRSRWLTVLVGPSLEDTLAELALTSGRGWPSSLGGRLLGLASALRYARQTGGDRATLARLEESLRQAIAAVGPRQVRGGGFGHAGADVRETCLTLWGLAAARDLTSFRPDVRASEVYLKNRYRSTRSQSEQARILHALAEIGRGDFKLANSLYRSRNALDPVALAQLALVFHRLDRLSVARELAARLPAYRTASKVPLSGAWQLLAMSRIQPGTPAAKAQAAVLLQGRGTGAGGQSAAEGLVVAALAEHLGQGQPASDDARITVLLDGKEIGVVTRRGASGATKLRVGPEVLGDRRSVVLRFRLEGRARYAYAATFRGFRPSYGRQTKNALRVRTRTYRHAMLRHRGKAIGAGSTSAVKNVELGQRVEVRLDLSARAPATSGLVLVEPIPAGLSLVPGSLAGGHVHHELRDGALRLYFRPGRWVSGIRYALVGRVPGSYRIPPSRLIHERDPSTFGRGAAGDIRVLGPGAKSPDPYRLNDSERLALGRLLFAEGEFSDALTYLTPLFERKKRPAEKELARMLLWIHTDPKHYDARMIVAAFEVLAVRYPELEVPFDKIFVVGRAYADLGEHERAMLVFRATIDASFLSDAGIGAILTDQGQNLGAVDYEAALWWDYPNSAQVAASLFATSQRLYQLAPQARQLAKEPRLDLPGLPAAAERKAPTRISLLARTIRTLRAFLAHHPQSPLADDAAFSLANAFLDLKRHEDVVNLSKKSLEVYPKSDFAGSFQYMEALGHFWRRDYSQASGSAKVVAEGKTRFHKLGKYILGQIHHAQGQPKEAIDWYSRVKGEFPDAKESIDYFTRRALTLPEVTTLRPGAPVEVEVKSRNLASARLEVYKVDLMKLYLREKDLSKITKVELAGIAPQLKLDVALGSITDYADKTSKAKLALKEEGAYLVIARGDDLFASGLVLITPLKIEVQEDASGRLRVNLQDTVKGIRPANVHVKAVGSSDGRFKSGETDLRGVFVADGLNGKATVIAKAGDARYAFHRGEKFLGQRRMRRPSPKKAPVDYDGYLRKQNRVMQEKSQQGWDQKRRRARKGVQVQEAR